MGLFVLMVVIFGVVFVLGYELGRNQNSSKVRAADVQSGELDSPKPLPNADALNPNSPRTPPNSSDGFNNPATSKQPPAPITRPGKESVNPGKTNTPPNATTPPKTTPSPAVTPPAGTTPPKTQPAPKTITTPKPVPAPAKNTTPPARNNGGTKSQGPSLNAPLIPRGAYLIQVAALTKESDALEMAEALQQRKFPAFVVPTGADKFFHVQVGPYADQKAAETARKALESAGFKTLIKH
jgi:cell division septation protein DedD